MGSFSCLAEPLSSQVRGFVRLEVVKAHDTEAPILRCLGIVTV